MFTARVQAVGSTGGHGSVRAASRNAGEDGFSLIELFVVCLIIGILCAIAIPQFLSQSSKAKESSAKELARTAETTAEQIATENEGSYESVTTTELNRDEPTLPIETSESHAYISAATHAPDEFSVTATATDGDELTISRSSTGAITRTCRSPVSKRGCSEGETGNW